MCPGEAPDRPELAEAAVVPAPALTLLVTVIVLVIVMMLVMVTMFVTVLLLAPSLALRASSEWR